MHVIRGVNYIKAYIFPVFNPRIVLQMVTIDIKVTITHIELAILSPILLLINYLTMLMSSYLTSIDNSHPGNIIWFFTCQKDYPLKKVMNCIPQIISCASVTPKFHNQVCKMCVWYSIQLDKNREVQPPIKAQNNIFESNTQAQAAMRMLQLVAKESHP